MLRSLMNAFSPLQVWRNARFLYDLDKPFLLTVYLAGLPLRFMALESFAVFVIEPLQRIYFPQLPAFAGLALGVVLIVLAVLFLKHWLSGVAFIALTVAVFPVFIIGGMTALPTDTLIRLLFGFTSLVCGYLSVPIFVQFSFIKRLAMRVPKQREVVVYSEDDDEEDWIFRGGIDASGGLSFYNWNSDRFDNNY